MINIKILCCRSLLVMTMVGNAIGDENVTNAQDPTISVTHNKEFAKEINGKTIEFVFTHIGNRYGFDNIMPIKYNSAESKHKPTLEVDSTFLYMYGSKIDDKRAKLPYFKPFINNFLIVFNNGDNDVIYKYGKEHNVDIKRIVKFDEESIKRKQQLLLQYNDVLSHYILTQAVVTKGTGSTCFIGNLVDKNNIPYSSFSLTNCKVLSKDKNSISKIMSAVIETE